MILDFRQPKEQLFAQFDTTQTWQEPIFEFLANWLNENVINFPINTSGSTGVPKTITHSRIRMMESAKRTNKFFGINQSSVLFLALPVRAIGGRMMLVRAQLAGCKIVCAKPSSLPFTSTSLTEYSVFDFAAFTPMQCFEILESKTQLEIFSQIKNIIIGGGEISEELREKLRKLPNNIYETFGMTETVSHIALRKISETAFTCLPGISVSVTEDSRLQIQLPDEAVLQTNDIVKLNGNNSFVWISRADDVINTGGIKAFANEIEAKLKMHISKPFFITSQPDEKFGQKIIFVTDDPAQNDDILNDIFSKNLTHYAKPKAILRVPRFVYSEMGKLMKKATLALIY